MWKYFKRISGVGSGNYIYFWKCKALTYENTKAPATTDYELNPQLSYFGTKTRVEFSGSCLKQGKILHDHGNVVNVYIVDEINKNFNISSYPTLENCLTTNLTSFS